MRTLVCALSAVVALVATPANAAPVTWQDSGFLTYVNNLPLFPGLTVGTPWSIAITFDPNSPFTPAALGQPASNCNIYNSQSTTLTLGNNTYTNATGRVWTNSLLPGDACSPAPTGAIQFDWVGGWTTPPGGWNLNSGFLIAGYTDPLTKDGSLPSVPMLTGLSSGLGFYAAVTGSSPAFQASTFEPSLVVPEPGTMSLVAPALAYGFKRARRKSQVI